MLKAIFGQRPTNKVDVILAAGTAVMAVVGALSTYREYKTEQDKKEEA